MSTPNAPSTPKLSKAEALRKTIERSRPDAVAQLGSEDKEVYDLMLVGDAKAIQKAQRAALGTPLYEAGGYVLADYLDLMDSIKRLDVEEDNGSGMSVVMVPMTPPAAGATPAASGAFPGLPGGFPGLGGGAAGAAPAAPGPSQSTVDEVVELLDAWQTRYGTPVGLFERDIVSTSLKSQNKELVRELLDRNIFRTDSKQEVRIREQGKTYLTNNAHDLKEVPFYEYWLNSRCTALLELATEHPTGKEMFLKATEDLQYYALQFAFDTNNKVLLEGLLDTGIDISNFTDPKHNAPLMCDFMYRSNESDVENLQLLVERGGNLSAVDPLHSTPLMVCARVGNLEGMKFLLGYDVCDLYAKNLMAESVLTIVEAGPEKRREDQEHYDEAVVRAKESFEEKHQEWQVRARAAEAAGKKAPSEPKMPELKPRPEDYPVELVTLVQDAWLMGDASKSAQAQAIAQSDAPHEFAIDFDSSI